MGVVVFGSLNMDLTTYTPRLPRPGETLFGSRYNLAAGGKGANQAVASAQLGAPTRFVGRAGADAFADPALEALQERGVDVNGVIRDPEAHTGLAVISVDQEAENSIVVISGANMVIDERDVARAVKALSEAKVLLLQLEVPLAASLSVARQAKDRDVTVILDPAPAQELPSDLFEVVDVLTPNEVEAEALVGFAVQSRQDAVEAARRLREKGARTVIVKLGQAGAHYLSDSGAGFQEAFEVQSVDSVAAGDAFNGGLAAALYSGLDLPAAVRWAAAAGALATTRRGAVPAMPSRAEVQRVLGEQ